MKRLRFLSLIGILLIVLAAALSCDGRKSGKTSLVTITIGMQQVATLDVRASTPLLQLKRWLGRLLAPRTAAAQVPSTVSTVRVTVTASDMETIIRTQAVAGLISVSIEIEVPNGKGRNFLVEGLDGSGAAVYSGLTSADLTGMPLTLPIILTAGLHVNIATGIDATGCGGAASPCKTITFALAQSSGNESIRVASGTYTAGPGGEAFPLQLKTGTLLICTGAGFSTVIDNSSGPDNTIVRGAAGAVVDGCKLHTAASSTWPAIDDGGSAMIIQNASVVDLSAMGLMGIQLSANSTVRNSTIAGFFSDGAGEGIKTSQGALVAGNNITGAGRAITVSGGTPTISNNTLSNNYWGMEIMGGSPSIINNQIQSSTYFGIVTQGATTPLISGNTIDNNSSSGVSVWGGNPTISGNAIMNNTNSTNNSSGIYVSAGTPTITGNLIHHNDNGIYVSGGLPSIHNNAIYCNNIVSGSYNYGDVYYSIFTTASFMTNNAWDHYTPGPTLGYSSTSGCSAGIDICVLSTPPTANYIPFNAAVSGGCP